MAEPAAPGEALAVTQGKFKGKPKGSWNPKKVKDKEGNDVMDMPCHIHPKKMKRAISFTQSIPHANVDS